MNRVATMALAMVVSSMFGCHHHGKAKSPAEAANGADNSTAAAQQPAPDNRTAGQVVADTLAAAGFACNANTDNWTCTSPGDSWSFDVSYAANTDGTWVVYLDSYAYRAFANKCAGFTDAMSDLVDTAHNYAVYCDDGTQQFRFSTSYNYADADDVAWFNQHDANRKNAYKLLDSIQAIRH